MKTIDLAEPLSKRRQLHKFGGSSLVDVKCYLRAARIIAQYSQPDDIIVVSAAGSTTNQLINWLKRKQNNCLSAYYIEQSLRYYQSQLITGLLKPESSEALINNLAQDLERLAQLLKSKITDACYAEVVGYGEIWSARLMAAVLNNLNMQAVWIDARDFLRAERAIQPRVDEGRSFPLLKNFLVKHKNKYLVVTGFISRNHSGETVLLGRNGSDYSATQIAALAGVMRVTIWSDVAGVYSADPRKVKDACLLPLLQLDEASELARLASPVLHARTLQPVSGSDIDLQLRCSDQSKQASTRIKHVLSSNAGAKIITSHDDISLVELHVIKQLDFNLVKKELELILQSFQIKPLAIGIYPSRNLFQLSYTAEVASSVLCILQANRLRGKLRLRKGLALVAVVGSGVGKHSLHSKCFYRHLKNQSVEFIWQEKGGLSLVAVLRKKPTCLLIQSLHHSLFSTKKRIRSEEECVSSREMWSCLSQAKANSCS